jgi:hypothetical protein
MICSASNFSWIARSRIGRARSMRPRMRSSVTGLAAQIRLILASHAPAVGPGGAAADRHAFRETRSGHPGRSSRGSRVAHQPEDRRGSAIDRAILRAASTRVPPEVAAGFQPAGSPGPGLCLCRLKTCTHFRAGCLEEVDSHHICATLTATNAPAERHAAPRRKTPERQTWPAPPSASLRIRLVGWPVRAALRESRRPRADG